MATTEKQFKYDYCGMSTDVLIDKEKDLFRECSDNILINKEPFKVYLDTKEVDAYIYIETIDMSEYTDNDNRRVVQLGIIPSFDSLAEKYQEGILSQFDDEDRERLLQYKDDLLRDVLDYGLSVTLYSETVELDKLEHTVNSAIAVHHAVKSLIGFDLDRIVNQLGNTGFDFLSDYCEGADLLKLVVDRYKEVKNHG